MSEVTLEVQSREAKGKNANRRLRASGAIPAVVYGGDSGPATIQVETRRMEELLRKAESDNPVFLLQLAGTDKSRHTMIRDMSVDAITGKMIHIDFLRVRMDEAVQVNVQIVIVGVPEGVTKEGGLLDFVTREIEISALPGDLPSQFDLDVSKLNVGHHLEVGDLEIPDGVTLLTSPDVVLVSVHSKQAEEVESEDEEAEVEEEVEAPAGEDA